MPKRKVDRPMDPSGFLRIITNERRFGYYQKQVQNVRNWTNYSPTSGAPIGTGTIGAGSNIPYEKTDRTGKSSNKPYRIKAAGISGQTFRRASNYRRTIGVIEYFDGSITYTDSQNRKIRQESGKATVSAPHFGPNISSTLALTTGSGLRSQAENEVLLKIKDQKIDIGTALAESRQTIAHLAHTAVSLYTFISNVRKGRWSKALKAIGVDKRAIRTGAAIGNRWLEYRYAWLPLMSDIQGAMTELQRGFRNEAQLFSAVRVVTRNNADDYPMDLASTYSYVEKNSIESVKVKIYFRVSDTELNKLTQLGLLNPLQVAWEIVPFSFMLDWLLPVGDFLEALDATRGLTFVSGSRSTRCAASYLLEWKPSYSGGTASDGYRMRVSGTILDRQNYATFPFPSFFYLKKSPFTIKRLTDAIAIGRQLFSSGMGHKR